MARKKRIWYPGATYHVMSRGNRRGAIFKDEGDYYMFMQCLEHVKKQYDFKIHSICLMTNHFHMSIETESVEIWKIELTYKYDFDKLETARRIQKQQMQNQLRRIRRHVNG